MKQLRFLVRCDADETCGFGHISRCLNIAREIRNLQRNADVVFIGNYSAFAQNLLSGYNFEFIPFRYKIENPTELLEKAKNFTHILVDSYAINQALIDVLSDKSFKFILLDDFGSYSNYSKVDLLLNFTIKAPGMNYGAKKSALGIAYFPVKPELKAVREIKLKTATKAIQKISFCISAMPEYWPLEEEILKLCDQAFSGVELKLISSRNEPFDFGSKNGNTFVQQKPAFTIENLYRQSDLVISGGGLLKYECAYCAIPNATLSLSQGVLEDTLLFEKENLSIHLGTSFSFDAQFTLDKLQQIQKNQVSPNFKIQSGKIFNTQSTENFVQLILTC